ncbi:MAG TPA: TonB-dependent receptor [Dongiaceae bacterium]|nr:TonB-dependent receptor [Dongiaceae bacterium]
MSDSLLSSPLGLKRRYLKTQLLNLSCAVCCLAAGKAAAAGTTDTNDVTKTLAGLSLSQLLNTEFDTVVGASKHEQTTAEAPAAVSIVTREEIKQMGCRTLADVLREVRGMYISFDRGYYFLGTRGVNRPGDYGGRILLNINGHRINEPIYDSLPLGYDFPLDVDLIERVEVIRGPGSALYGNNAFFGIINVVTRPGHDVGGKGVETSGSYGSFDAYSGRFTYGNRFTNGMEVLLSGTYYESAGNPELTFPEYSSINNGVIRDFDGEKARQLFASLSYGDFTLEGLYGRRDKEIPTAAYNSVFGDKREKFEDQRGYAELRFQHEFASDWTLTARGYGDYYDYDGVYPYDYQNPSQPGVVLNKDVAKAIFYGGEVQASRTFLSRHRVTVGLEGRDDVKKSQLNYDIDPAFTYIDSTSSSSSLGAYVQDEFSICTNLTLNLGGRYDHFSQFGGVVNPRIALIYHPVATATLKLLYGEAYRAPNAYEMDYSDGVYYVANPELQPETIRSYELEWEQNFAKYYRFTGTVFYNQVNSLITQVVNGSGQYTFENTDSVDVLGGEVELEGRWQHGWRGRVSYAYADATDNATGLRLNNSPAHVGKLQLIVPVYREKMFAGLELQATSERITVQGNTVPGFAVANFTLFSRELARGLEASASIYNVFDHRYADPVGPDFTQDTIPQDGRTFRVKLTWRF